MGPVRLEGPRIVLREYQPADFGAVHAYASDPEVTRYVAWGPNDEEVTRAFLDFAHQTAREDPRGTYPLAVVLRETAELLGGAELRILGPDRRRAAIGYVLNRRAWGQGIATEAARLLIRFGFEELHLHRIEATCDPHNLGSRRVLEKAGLQLEGRIRHDLWTRGGWRDSLLFSILEGEFRD